MGKLDDMSIIVTGASRGLGREMSLRYSKEGAKVTLVARSQSDLKRVAAEASGESLVVPTDVRKAEQVDACVKATIDSYGKVDVLVNNAGVGLLSIADQKKNLVDITEQEWDTIIETNLKGVFLFSRSVIPSMVSRERGHIINISSGFGRRPAPGMGPYATTKWGVEGLTKSLALELSDSGVLVNGLDPGGRVKTRFWDHIDEEDELLDPTVMNNAAVMLASQGPNGLTGQSLDAKEWEKRLG